MNFEVQNALIRLDAKTTDFFVIEALAEPDHKLRETTTTVLRSLGDKSATRQLLTMLRLY